MESTKTVMVTGNFNVLHPGHIRLMKFAKACAGKLLVGVFSDQIAQDAVDNPQEMRMEALSSINMVDEVFPIDTTLFDFIHTHRPDIIVKGKEFENLYNPEEDILKIYGGQLIFSSGEVGTIGELPIKDKSDISQPATVFINKFITRHNISVTNILDIVDRFSERKICVLGDTIIDEYIDCFPLGMSQEEPTLVVSPQETKRFLGGAGIVALHASRLGASVRLLSVSGCDEARNFAAAELEKYGVESSYIIDATRPTTVKQRFRSQGKSLLRVSTLSQQAISSHLQKMVLSQFEQAASKFDSIIFSDFNYGALPQPLVDAVISVAKKNNLFIAADSQSSSQIGNISRFRGADLITPTEREARLAIQNHDDGLVVLADKLMRQAGAKYILLKLGAEGMLAQHADENIIKPHTERLEALNQQPIDVSGAGDSVLITSTLALAAGANLWEAGLLGSLAAFIQVGRVGNIPINRDEILQVLS
jgi:rfaE bifunctional protein kinase chain/domain